MTKPDDRQIALVDDHTLFAEGFKALLSQSDGNYSVTTFDQSAILLKQLSDGLIYDLIVLDLVMKDMNGLALLAAIRKLQPNARVLMLSGIAGDAPIAEMKRMGANGFVHKSVEMDALLESVKVLLSGEDLGWDETVSDSAVMAEAAGGFPHAGEPLPKLAPRQLEVISLIAAGKTNRQIADEMSISENTVKSHTRAIFEALDVRTRTACVRKSQSLGLI